MSTYAIKMARATAPAIDRAARRLYQGGYPNVLDGLSFSYRNMQVLATFASEEDYKVGAAVLAEELRADGFGWSTTYDNANAITGKMVGLRITHPSGLTRMGDEVRDRPSSWSVTGPMPDGRVYLDAEAIERLAQEAAEVVRDMLRVRSLEEFGKLPPGCYDLPEVAANPLETCFDRDVAEHNDERVEDVATQPRSLAEVFGTEEDDDRD